MRLIQQNNKIIKQKKIQNQTYTKLNIYKIKKKKQTATPTPSTKPTKE